MLLRVRWVRIAAVCAVAVAGAACGDAVAATERVIPLDALARGPVVLGDAVGRQAVELPYRLAPGAAQGPRRWWTMRLRYRLRLSPESTSGIVRVVGETNGRTVIQIAYSLRRRNGQLTFRRTAADVDGQREHRGRGRRDAFEFENFLQYAGVRGGRNTWTIRLEQDRHARIDRLEVLGSSAIVHTTRTPYALRTVPRLVGGAPVVGRPFRVLVTARDRSGRAVPELAIRASVDRSAMRQSQVRRRGSASEFTFVPKRTGRATIEFVTRRGAKAYATSSSVNVAAHSARSIGTLTWIAVVTPALVMLTLLARTRKRSGSR